MKRFFYRSLIVFSVLLFIPLILLFFVFQAEPSVTQSVVSKPGDAKRARAIFREFRALTEATTSKRSLKISQDDVNSVIAVARRAIPGLRGQSDIGHDKLRVQISFKNPYFPWGWVNFDGTITSSEKGLMISSASVGPYSLPASWLIPSAAFVLDFALGDNLGQVAANSIGKVEIVEKNATFHVALNRSDRKNLARKFKNRVRKLAGIGNEKEVRYYYYAMDKAAKAGELPTGGSILPYIRFALNKVVEKSTPIDLKEQKQAALLALAIYCGHPKFEQIVGRVGKGREKWKTRCFYNSFAKRGDLGKHFIISSGLIAASDAGFAFAIGEFKELLDSNKGGSGFSFDDLAADRAGIRFAEVILSANKPQLRLLVKKLISEDAIFPSVQGLPVGLTKEQFAQQFGDVESVSYKAMLRKIEKRIENLAFYKKG